jgi:stage II sporulation protein D
MTSKSLGLDLYRNTVPVWKLIALLLLSAMLTKCASSPSTIKQPVTTPEEVRPSLTLKVEYENAGIQEILHIPLEEYVMGSVLSEVALGLIAPSSRTYVARLQAVLARTYAVVNRGRHYDEGFDLCSSTHCQLYKPLSVFSDDLLRVAKVASLETEGLIIVYNNRPIQALFHSDCGGHTSSAGLVWGGPTPPYLHAVEDSLDIAGTHTSWTFSIAPKELLAALNQDKRTYVGERLNRVEIVERDISGRAVRIVLDGDRAPMVRGEELRAVITRHFGPRTIRSTRFEVGYDGDLFVFSGTGFGHGVGLCQRGAIARIQAGQSFREIIQHYYSNVTLQHLNQHLTTLLDGTSLRDLLQPRNEPIRYTY